ncbi:MAG: integration host factor subunit beta [Gammaproteobacteria bacterium]|nr:integration host factor subunit beta [Gammaproteobacteria bacterium]
MTKSELIDSLSQKLWMLPLKDVDMAVKTVLDEMSDALANEDRIEIRGFGSFSLHQRKSRIGRNPRTGEPVMLESKQIPHFKPGKELRDRINASKNEIIG